MEHYEEVLKILHDQFDWKLTDSLTTTGKKLVADTIKALKITETNQALKLQQSAVSGSVFRPNNGHELLQALKENKQCEVVDTHAFLAAKALEDNNCGFSFSCKKSELTKGWTLFKKL